jgi:hypothetical protein
MLNAVKNSYKQLRVQYASSLYVDKYEKVIGAHFVRPVAPILVLNGNIGKVDSEQMFHFLQHCSRLYSEVMYVPGSYEIGNGDLDKIIEKMKKNLYVLNNVHVLNNSIAYLEKYNITFLGTMNDKAWLRDQFTTEKLFSNEKSRIVAVTHNIPNYKMVHPVDKYNSHNSKNYTVYPKLDAWICGYLRGSYSHTYQNGVRCMYNARGAIDGKNDFNRILGWSRSKYVDLT